MRYEHISARFFNKLDHTANSECWLWAGGTDRDGRPIMHVTHVGGRKIVIRAARIALQLAGQLIPTGTHTHHTCRNRLCVNPDHLAVLTPEQHYAEHKNLRTADKASTIPPDSTTHALNRVEPT